MGTGRWKKTWIRVDGRVVPLEQWRHGIPTDPIYTEVKGPPKIDWAGTVLGILIFAILIFVVALPGCSTGRAHPDLTAACQHCRATDIRGRMTWACGDSMRVLEEEGGCALRPGSTR